jgi:hypothetical protein
MASPIIRGLAQKSSTQYRHGTGGSRECVAPVLQAQDRDVRLPYAGIWRLLPVSYTRRALREPVARRGYSPMGPHTTSGHSNTSPVARSGPERISPTPGTGRDLGGERRVLHVFWLSPRPARYGYRQVSENDGWRVFGLLPVSHGRGPPLTVFVARLEVSAGLTRGATQQRVVELFSPNLTTVQFLLRLPSPSAALALLCRPSARTLQSYSAQRVTVR